MSQTLDFYNSYAEGFTQMTQHLDFSNIQNKFLSLLPEHARILDFGCGSGRDSKVFLEKGYQVDAIDGSEKMCQIAEEYVGIPVRNMKFQELKEENRYDGIWACSSILHVEKAELKQVLKAMTDALKTDGYIYTSFKYGEFEGIRNGRYFTNMTEQLFDELLQTIPELDVVEYFVTGDVRVGREDEKWLNILLHKRIM